MGTSGCRGEAGPGHSGQGGVTPALGAGLELEPGDGGAAGLTRRLEPPELLPPAVVFPGRLRGKMAGSSQGQPLQSAHFQSFSCR